MNFGSCWGRVHNPHNSTRKPGKDYVQAKTDIHCDNMLDAGDTIAVTNRLYIRLGSGQWLHQQTNHSVCPAGTSTTGWVNCSPLNTGAHVMMEVGVNSLCEIGSTEDYVQQSTAVLTKANGSTFVGSANKFAFDVFCAGKS